MNVSELHPDELLWREACGTLTADERADLASHLRRCPACALERVARLEAARARVPSEADHALAARLVDRVLANTHQRGPATVMRAGWRRPVAAAAALVVLVAGTAFAATALVARVRAQRAAPALASRSPAASLETATRRRPPARGPAVSSSETAQTADTAAPSADVPIAPVMSPGRSRRAQRDAVRPQSRPLRSRTLAVAASDRRVEPQPPLGQPPLGQPTSARAAEDIAAPSAPTPPAPIEAAATAVGVAPALEAPLLLRRAEQARTARRWSDASRVFADLGRQYPGTREEIVGRALHGQLLLDQLGEPRRALTMFERYLGSDPSGALAEEARLGRAQALRTLGRPDEERAAWRELMREHPGSVHAAAARQRLAALEAP